MLCRCLEISSCGWRTPTASWQRGTFPHWDFFSCPLYRNRFWFQFTVHVNLSIQSQSQKTFFPLIGLPLCFPLLWWKCLCSTKRANLFSINMASSHFLSFFFTCGYKRLLPAATSCSQCPVALQGGLSLLVMEQSWRKMEKSLHLC